jgi:hypothetical protein
MSGATEPDRTASPVFSGYDSQGEDEQNFLTIKHPLGSSAIALVSAAGAQMFAQPPARSSAFTTIPGVSASGRTMGFALESFG